MQPMSFHPVMADIGAQVVEIGMRSLETGARTSMAVTGLAPAGADEVSTQAVTAFQSEAASMLDLHQAAQKELMRAGAAFRQIAQTYTAVDGAAAERLLLALFPITNPWLAG